MVTIRNISDARNLVEGAEKDYNNVRNSPSWKSIAGATLGGVAAGLYFYFCSDNDSMVLPKAPFTIGFAWAGMYSTYVFGELIIKPYRLFRAEKRIEDAITERDFLTKEYVDSETINNLKFVSGLRRHPK